MDITHFEGHHYLSLTDCIASIAWRPSRFALWRHLRRQDSDTAAVVVQQLKAVFFERGAPYELTMTQPFAAERSSSSWRGGAFKSTFNNMLMFHREMVSSRDVTGQ